VSARVRLWRIATETLDYKANDLSGAGAAKHPGRWNDAGEYVVYAAPSIAMAVLETAAHIDPAGLPLNRFLVAIDVPQKDWNARRELDTAALDAAWSAIPAGRASVEAGSAWYRSARSLILMVPSVIVPEERVAVINARHAAARGLVATTMRAFSYGTLYR
jgi:RES domain-containing protein